MWGIRIYDFIVVMLTESLRPLMKTPAMWLSSVIDEFTIMKRAGTVADVPRRDP